jgi:hypothetical protein
MAKQKQHSRVGVLFFCWGWACIFALVLSRSLMPRACKVNVNRNLSDRPKMTNVLVRKDQLCEIQLPQIVVSQEILKKNTRFQGLTPFIEGLTPFIEKLIFPVQFQKGTLHLDVRIGSFWGANFAFKENLNRNLPDRFKSSNLFARNRSIMRNSTSTNHSLTRKYQEKYSIQVPHLRAYR